MITLNIQWPFKLGQSYDLISRVAQICFSAAVLHLTTRGHYFAASLVIMFTRLKWSLRHGCTFQLLILLFRVLTIIFSPQIVEEHCSVEQSRRAQAEPISLDSCLKAFTSEEELGEDELYYCSKCKTHRLATKKLDLWRLPPILVSLSLGKLYAGGTTVNPASDIFNPILFRLST